MMHRVWYQERKSFAKMISMKKTAPAVLRASLPQEPMLAPSVARMSVIWHLYGGLLRRQGEVVQEPQAVLVLELALSASTYQKEQEQQQKRQQVRLVRRYFLHRLQNLQ